MRALLREHDWDFAFISFGEAHAGGHYLWHSSDDEFPVRPPDGIGARDLLRDVYIAVDRAIGDILEDFDDATVIVMSVDGMGPNYSASHFMPEVLHRMDLFHSNDVGRNAYAGEHTKRSLLRELREAIPLSARQTVSRCLPAASSFGVSWRGSTPESTGPDLGCSASRAATRLACESTSQVASREASSSTESTMSSSSACSASFTGSSTRSTNAPWWST